MAPAKSSYVDYVIQCRTKVIKWSDIVIHWITISRKARSGWRQLPFVDLLLEEYRYLLLLFQAALRGPLGGEEPVDDLDLLIREMGELLLRDDAHHAAFSRHVPARLRQARLHEPPEFWQRVGLDDNKRRSVHDLLVRLMVAVDAADDIDKMLSGWRTR